jgi:hypothetical protein
LASVVHAGALGLLLALPACGDGTGVVELSWVLVDRNGDQIYPEGALTVGARRNSCDFTGITAAGPVSFDLRVQLEICDPACAAGCDDPSCLVVDPLRFPCTTFRGSNANIPSSEDPYQFRIRAVVEAGADGIECLDPEPTCVAVPGPRERPVADGLVTDLQVYQVVVDIEAGRDEELDLEACGCA